MLFEKINELLEHTNNHTFTSNKARNDAYELYNQIFYKDPEKYGVKKVRQPATNKGCSTCQAKVIAKLKDFVSLPEETIPEKTYKERIQICKSCDFYNPTFFTCGKPLIGGTVKHKGAEIKLCGCEVYLKARFGGLHCPARKW